MGKIGIKNRFCQCEILLNLQTDMIYKKITEYLSGLEEEECVENSAYEERLKRCSVCERLAGD